VGLVLLQVLILVPFVGAHFARSTMTLEVVLDVSTSACHESEWG
jgi:hypothetical protein